MRPALLLCTFSCASPRVEGYVVDHSGQGIVGVSVAAKAGASVVKTDEAGRYALPLSPGQQTLSFTHPDFFQWSTTVNVAPDAATVLPHRTLIRTPDGTGLYVLSGAEVLPLSPARLKRQTRTVEGSKLRSYCISGPQEASTTIPKGETHFVDMNSSSWRLFKLDSDGCAYRDAKDADGRWVVQYRDKPDVQPNRSPDEAAFSAARLDAGTYFVADWGGFFVSDPDDPEHYTGRLLRIEG